MPEIRIDYLLNEEGQPVPLLTPRQRDTLFTIASEALEEAEILEARAQEPGNDALLASCLRALTRRKNALRQIADDDWVRGECQSEIRTLRVEVKEPTADLTLQVEAAGRDFEDLTKFNPSAPLRKAYELLSPRIVHEVGENYPPGGEILPEFREVLEEECHALLKPVLTERRKGFIEALRLRSRPSNQESPPS